MGARKCLRDHNITYGAICGTNKRLYGWMRHDFYCNTCNKAKSIHFFWLNLHPIKTIKRWLGIDSGLPF